MDDKRALSILPEMIYIAFYVDDKGNQSRGDWKQNEDGIEEEKKRYGRAGYRWIQTSTITKQAIIDTAKECNTSIVNTLRAL